MLTIFDDDKELNQNALTETGYMKPFEALTVDDKEEVISILIDYHCLIKPKAAMDQFAEGLRCTGVLHYIKNYGSVLRDHFKFRLSILTAGKSINRSINDTFLYIIYIHTSLFTESLKELFTVTYSVDQRSVEEQAYVFFGDFLDDCEGTML